MVFIVATCPTRARTFPMAALRPTMSSNPEAGPISARRYSFSASRFAWSRRISATVLLTCSKSGRWAVMPAWISQAAASLVTEKVLGKSLDEVSAMNHEAVVDELGREVVANRLRCATLALNTLKAAEKKYRAGQAAKSASEAPLEDF